MRSHLALLILILPLTAIAEDRWEYHGKPLNRNECETALAAGFFARYGVGGQARPKNAEARK